MLIKKSPFIKLKILHCIYLFLGLFIFTTTILYFQTAQNYKSSVMTRLTLSLDVLDGQFEQASNVVNTVIKNITGDCATDHQFLSNTMVNMSSMQSINVIKDGKIVCSTYENSIGEKSRSAGFDTFEIIISKAIVPGKTVAVLKSQKNDLIVTATLHGFLLFGVVNILEMDTPFHINSVDGWINNNNQLTKIENSDDIYVKSERFPYSISTTIEHSKIFLYFLKSNVWLFFILFVFSIFISVFYFFYDNKREVIQSIKHGIKNREFIPYAQGVTNPDGKLSGCEVLMRWNNKSGIIGPDEFIPIAETSGLIVPMSIFIINETYEQLLKNYYSIPDDFHVGFNISPVQLTKKYAAELIKACGQFRNSQKLNKIKVILELTERQIVSYTPETIETIKQLHEMGINIVIDDFGTGYSSLENILELNIDGLKIDKRFVDRYPSDSLSAALIDNMFDLANRLGVPVVAEGVETKEQADALCLKGVQLLQGYLYYKPVCIDKFIAELKIKQK